MTQDELEDQLFLAMLQLSRNGEGPIFDLQLVCRQFAIPAGPSELLSFVRESDGLFGSKRYMTLEHIYFELSASGLRHAKSIEAQGAGLGRTGTNEKKNVNWTKWGAVGALLAIPTMVALWWFS